MEDVNSRAEMREVCGLLNHTLVLHALLDPSDITAPAKYLSVPTHNCSRRYMVPSTSGIIRIHRAGGLSGPEKRVGDGGWDVIPTGMLSDLIPPPALNPGRRTSKKRWAASPSREPPEQIYETFALSLALRFALDLDQGGDVWEWR